METPSTQHAHETANRTADGSGRVFRGVVVAAKMQDTCTVAVERYVKHPKYKKYQRRTKKYLVHDAGNTASVGETVEIRETRPISKRKHFVLVGSVQK
jgi:small subunit ribosomal protein S17